MVRSTINVQQGLQIPLSNKYEIESQTENEWRATEPEPEYAEYFKEKYS